MVLMLGLNASEIKPKETGWKDSCLTTEKNLKVTHGKPSLS